MTGLDIARQRLLNQRLAGNPFEKPEDVVRWLGAVQAQDYAGAKWAIAQRATGATDAGLDRAFNQGAILRTHLMRPTWHFVRPADIRWMLSLTGPRVNAVNAYYYRQHELDEALFRRSNALLAGALQGGRQLTRAELAAALRDGGIPAGGPRLAYLIMRAELDAVICSGARRGKQFTYALLEERVPPAPALARDEALAELTRRYFASHGPATVQDYAWWSGLAAADAKAGLEMVRPGFLHENLHGKTYWFVEPKTPVAVKDPTIHLLPNYDEHLVAYKDHAPSFDPQVLKTLAPDESALMGHILIRNGLVIGGWRRTLQKDQVTINTSLLAGLDEPGLGEAVLDEAGQAALQAAAQGYGWFMGLPARLS